MRPHLARWLAATLAAGACDRATPPEPRAADRTPRAAAAASPAADAGVRPPVGDLVQIANMPAGTACPPYSFVNNVNHAVNPSFEFGPGYATWPPGPSPIPSAATGWYMHTDNVGAPIRTQLVPTTVPGPGGARMLAVRAGGAEGGVYQVLNTPAKVMFSAWVWVNAGHVVLGAHAMVDKSPYSWSTKIGEWEQLRICTDGANPTGYFFIYNEDPAGGSFYVDRVEIRHIP